MKKFIAAYHLRERVSWGAEKEGVERMRMRVKWWERRSG